MAKITIKELESLTAKDAGRILREDGNLAGRISVRKDGVSVSFFYRYRWGDQNKEYACGTWPRKSLTDILKGRNQARILVRRNRNKLAANSPSRQAKSGQNQSVELRHFRPFKGGNNLSTPRAIQFIWRISDPSSPPDFSICSMRCHESEAVASNNMSTSCIFFLCRCAFLQFPRC